MWKKITVLPLALLLMSACTATRAPLVEPTTLPAAWQANSTKTGSAPDSWLEEIAPDNIAGLVRQAVNSNYALKQQAINVQLAAERVKQQRAGRLPALNLNASGSRGRPADGVPISDSVSIGAGLSFELDLWGKLSDAQRAAELDLAAEEIRYLDAERRLAASVVSSAFNTISSEQLNNLFSQRLANLSQGLDIIEQGYKSGLNEALDVYLAQTTVEQERANVANQRQVSFANTTELERLLSEYPGATRTLGATLPALPDMPQAGVPADLLTRRPDVQAAWLNVLAADADLAVAHKNRFFNLTLTGNVSDTDNAVSRLLDGGSLAFSAAASLLQPVFNGGRLASLETQARLGVEQAEQRYLDVVFTAFAEVENELQRAHTLEARYEAFINAEANAEAALELAFDQYQRGLVTFTTVLESQRRAFDAQTTVVQLRNQLLQSRVALLLALGGNY